MAFRTLTFVVRVDDDTDQDFEGRLVRDILDNPKALLNQDNIMFWGQEHGVSETALELGADPACWPWLDDLTSNEEN